MLTITEPDWKLFRKKVPNWQERYMEKLNREYIELLTNENETASAKFWKLEKQIREDRKSLGVIIDMRRSTAVHNIISLLYNEVITLEDLKDFSAELQDAVSFVAKMK
jgi:hypothetical protein